MASSHTKRKGDGGGGAEMRCGWTTNNETSDPACICFQLASTTTRYACMYDWITCIVDSLCNWHCVNLHSLHVWYAAHLDRNPCEMGYADRRHVFSMHAWSRWRSTTQDLLQLSGIGWPSIVPTSTRQSNSVFSWRRCGYTYTMQETLPTEDPQHFD